MTIHAPIHPLRGHFEYGCGQSVAWIRPAPAFATYRQTRLGLIAEYYQGVAPFQGAIGNKRLGPPLTVSEDELELIVSTLVKTIDDAVSHLGNRT